MARQRCGFPVLLAAHDHVPYVETVNDCHIVKVGADAVKAAIIDIVWPNAAEAVPFINVRGRGSFCCSVRCSYPCASARRLYPQLAFGPFALCSGVCVLRLLLCVRAPCGMCVVVSAHGSRPQVRVLDTASFTPNADVAARTHFHMRAVRELQSAELCEVPHGIQLSSVGIVSWRLSLSLSLSRFLVS